MSICACKAIQAGKQNGANGVHFVTVRSSLRCHLAHCTIYVAHLVIVRSSLHTHFSIQGYLVPSKNLGFYAFEYKL